MDSTLELFYWVYDIYWIGDFWFSTKSLRNVKRHTCFEEKKTLKLSQILQYSLTIIKRIHATDIHIWIMLPLQSATGIERRRRSEHIIPLSATGTEQVSLTRGSEGVISVSLAPIGNAEQTISLSLPPVAVVVGIEETFHFDVLGLEEADHLWIGETQGLLGTWGNEIFMGLGCYQVCIIFFYN